jgi:hypothetical protein
MEKIITDVARLLNKFGVKDPISFDKTFNSTLDKSMTNGLSVSNTNNGVFYKLSDRITFIIPDKLDSCYNSAPSTIFVLLLDELSFLSGDGKTWVAQGFGQVHVDDDLTGHQKYHMIKKYSKDTETHRSFLVERYTDLKSGTESIMELQKIMGGKNLVKISERGVESLGYRIEEDVAKRSDELIKFIQNCLEKLENGSIPSEVESGLEEYRKINKI